VSSHNSLMAYVSLYDGLYSVELGGVLLAQFRHLLDAHCFALQLMDRDLAKSVRLYSGITVV
jgi:hypothetical protein